MSSEQYNHSIDLQYTNVGNFNKLSSTIENDFSSRLTGSQSNKKQEISKE
jgi:hypothetical protein